MALQPVTPRRAAWRAGASSRSAPRGLRATGLSTRGNGSWAGEGLTCGGGQVDRAPQPWSSQQRGSGAQGSSLALPRTLGPREGSVFCRVRVCEGRTSWNLLAGRRSMEPCGECAAS